MKRIALDSMVFIYIFEHSALYFPQAEEILISIEKGMYEGVTSMISVAESLSAKKLHTNTFAQDEILRFFHEVPHLAVLPVAWEIAQTAANLRRTYPSLGTPDAIQLATTVEAKADVFITNDKNLLRLSKQPIPIVSMTRFLSSN